jgi:selenocysteine-specific elongation factor
MMKPTRVFDALLDIPMDICGEVAAIRIGGKRIRAELAVYEAASKGSVFVQVAVSPPVTTAWGDAFEIEDAGRNHLGSGAVLHPFPPEFKKADIDKRLPLLRLLAGDAAQMLQALAEEKGIRGLNDEEWAGMTRLEPEKRQAAALEIESRGRIRILSFEPLHIISQPAFEFLCRRIETFLSRFHEDNPGLRGLDPEKIRERFKLSRQVLRLALGWLRKEGKIVNVPGGVALAGFEMALTPEEERILRELEKTAFRGEFDPAAREEIRRTFRIGDARLDFLMSVLVERKKIVEGFDGFYVHARWLDELTERLKKSGRREITVADFKELTGLSRKYAIPLLELLDRIGVTQRTGNTRHLL